MFTTSSKNFTRKPSSQICSFDMSKSFETVFFIKQSLKICLKSREKDWFQYFTQRKKCSVLIVNFSGRYFSVFGLNKAIYRVSLRVQSTYEKIRTWKNPNRNTFHAVLLTKVWSQRLNHSMPGGNKKVTRKERKEQKRREKEKQDFGKTFFVSKFFKLAEI